MFFDPGEWPVAASDEPQNFQTLTSLSAPTNNRGILHGSFWELEQKKRHLAITKTGWGIP